MKTSLGVFAFVLAALVATAQTLYTPSGSVGSSSTSNVGIGRSDPVARLDVQGATADANAWALWLRNSNGNAIVGSRNDGYFMLGNGTVDQVVKDASGKVGIGTISPTYLLHVSGNVGVNGDQKFFARYNGTEDYKGSFGWSHLQLGNNGPNWIVAGRTQAGGALTFVVNNTVDYTYGGFNGIAALHLSANGNVGIGTTSPVARFHVKGTHAASQVIVEDSTLSDNWQIGTNTGSLSSAHTFSFYSTEFGPTHGYLPLLQLSGADGSVLISPGQGTGNVGIGTTNPTHKLSVNGTIRAKEVIVDTGWADHVFAADYRLAPLSEVEQHIQQNGHLPDVPSAADVAARGVSVGEMQKILLQKIEELTLHQIEQEKRLNSQAERIRVLETENAQLRQR